jgi:hypothetical protein
MRMRRKLQAVASSHVINDLITWKKRWAGQPPRGAFLPTLVTSFFLLSIAHKGEAIASSLPDFSCFARCYLQVGVLSLPLNKHTFIFHHSFSLLLSSYRR